MNDVYTNSPNWYVKKYIKNSKEKMQILRLKGLTTTPQNSLQGLILCYIVELLMGRCVT